MNIKLNIKKICLVVLFIFIIKFFLQKAFYYTYIHYFKVDIDDQTFFVNYNNESNFSMTTKTIAYVVMSVDFNTNFEYYYFYLPIICLSWRLINYEPIIISVFSNSSSSISKTAEKTIEYLNLFRIKIAYLKTEPDYERLTSMLARLLVGLLDDKIVKYNDTIFLSDADLLPISKNYYHNFNRDETSVKCFEAISLSTFKYTPENKDYKMFTIPHIGLTKKKWLEMMKLNDESKFDGKTALSLVIKYYGFSFLKKNKELLRGGDSWFLDQKILAISLAKYMKSNKHVFMYINKGFGIKQHRDTTSDSEILNIINTYNYNLLDFMHLYHDNYIDKINILILLFKRLLEKNQFNSINQYIKEFILLRK